jgi:hypothetical protein
MELPVDTKDCLAYRARSCDIPIQRVTCECRQSKQLQGRRLQLGWRPRVAIRIGAESAARDVG